MGIANRKIESFVSEAARLDIRERERERERVCAPGPRGTAQLENKTSGGPWRRHKEEKARGVSYPQAAPKSNLRRSCQCRNEGIATEHPICIPSDNASISVLHLMLEY